LGSIYSRKIDREQPWGATKIPNMKQNWRAGQDR
jgi:hypothetical protein